MPRPQSSSTSLLSTRNGVRIAVHINVADPDELDRLDPATCDGIGLVRTELLFHRSGGLPDEEAQYAAYRRIVEWAQGRPVTIRTLDAGGDKPIAGLTLEGESNPFLGVRGIRLSLLRPEIFRVQLRALARAAVHGSVKIMLPMVTVPSELAAARAFLEGRGCGVGECRHCSAPATARNHGRSAGCRDCSRGVRCRFLLDWLERPHPIRHRRRPRHRSRGRSRRSAQSGGAAADSECCATRARDPGVK